MTDLVRLSVSHRYSASPERVFDAWLDPEKAGHFLFATPGGRMTRVEIDPVVGGGFTITEQRGEVEAEHVGRYLEIDRPRRLVFEFGVPAYSSEMGRVEIDIAPLEAGCRLTLTAWVDPEYADRTEQDWTKILAGLETVF
ncbi:SRPBCC domain-containing protein [Caulobacter sp. SLTY]|uniref:SRPBCC family protein n=1 Tax=Caulobacter sp. SLTY TaxID=2683262 RepID=UPI001411DC41|nr:SRPBCC family protein [Caulobacter sp. SLTY]NBB16254.1 SRPBCC domain-containing protein [Caulobacter sp. SLTY]